MKKEILWQKITSKNQRFKTEGARFTARGLRKFFDQAYDKGREQGMKEGMEHEPPDFGRIFGGVLK